MVSDTLFSPRSSICRRFSSGVLEHRPEIGDADLVVVAERGAAADPLAVDPRPVPSPQVLDRPLPVLEPELRVPLADCPGGDGQVAVGFAPDHEAVGIERDYLPETP